MTVVLWYVELIQKDGERKSDFTRFLSFESACKFGKKNLLEHRILKFAICRVEYEDDERLDHQQDAKDNEAFLDTDDSEITICSMKKRR
jgi:hypothetical protein